jgi:ABC-2 type transport system ATP-binding protein
MTVNQLGWFVSGFYKAGFLNGFLELADRFRLDPEKKLSQLTKGGYAKIGLALALAHEPEVLILDEPTSGLDLFTRRDFLGSMVDLAGAGRTIFLSSHQIAEVERVASHVAFLAEGKLLLTASLDELRQQIVRFRWRCEGVPGIEPGALGNVLQHSESGRHWEVILRNPRPDALNFLRGTPGILDAEQLPLTLEEVYSALLGRQWMEGEPKSAKGELVS